MKWEKKHILGIRECLGKQEEGPSSERKGLNTAPWLPGPSAEQRAAAELGAHPVCKTQTHPWSVLPCLDARAGPGVEAEPGASRAELWDRAGSLRARWLVVARCQGLVTQQFVPGLPQSWGSALPGLPVKSAARTALSSLRSILSLHPEL